MPEPFAAALAAFHSGDEEAFVLARKGVDVWSLDILPELHEDRGRGR